MKNNLLDMFIRWQFNTVGARNKLIADIRAVMEKEKVKYEFVCNIFILEFDFEKNLVQICKDFDFSDEPDIEMNIEDFINFLQNVKDVPK